MSIHITLTATQLALVQNAKQQVEVRDEEGRTIGHIQTLTPQEQEMVERWRRSQNQPRQPRIPEARVQEMLSKFHEVDDREGMTWEKAQAILRRVEAGEPL